MSLPTVGFICDARIVPHPFNRHHVATLDRAVPLAEALQSLGVELFLFSPHHVNPRKGMATGFVIENGRFVQVSRPVPRVNGNWYYNLYPAERTAANMSMAAFVDWGELRDIHVHPSLKFSILVCDKYVSYRAISQVMPDLQPHTELFEHSATQLESALQKHRRIFLKPRYGGHGDGIFVIEKSASGFDARFYLNHMRWSATTASLGTLAQNLGKFAGTTPYILQAAVDTHIHGDKVFDVRVMLVNVGNTWACFPLIRLGAQASDVSNVGQGGTSEEPVEILERFYSRPAAVSILDNIKHVSIQIARHFDEQYPPGIPELALDVVIDQEDSPRLLEINIQPAMGFPGAVRASAFYQTYQDIFHLSKDEQAVYDKYTRPYGQCLARYFYSQLMGTPAAEGQDFSDCAQVQTQEMAELVSTETDGSGTR